MQNIEAIPADVKDVFRTAWEINPKMIIDLAADRAPFIDQTQSMSLNVRFPTTDLLVSPQSMCSRIACVTVILCRADEPPIQRDLQLHAWARGLKTGMYYLRTQAPAYPLPFGIAPLPRPTANSFLPEDGGAGTIQPDAAECDSCSG